jgi:hypothetical protein
MTPTPAEREAFVWMQGRMVELLLRYDAPRFGATFGEQIARQLSSPHLRRERELAVLFYLRDELFEGILPRIRRRLSFAAPRETAVEALPPRGRIDWPRTAAAGLGSRPGEPPLEVHTRQRRRHFATPENLLTVATLLQYRETARRLLDEEVARAGAWAVRHPLHGIAERCTRELAFLQFAGLVREAGAVVEGFGATTVETLEAAVAANLLPGRNSAYDELLDWRRRLSELDLLDRSAGEAPLPMLGSDPKRDNYLYQLWLFYELGDLLQARGALLEWETERMALRFAWGEGETRQIYRLQHDQAIAGAQVWAGGPSVPGVRPDLYIEREGRQELRDEAGALIWREPGYVLDAKYYRERENGPDQPSGPKKRMIADLQLTGERHGALLFAFHGVSPAGEDGGLRPDPRRAQYVQPDLRIDTWQVRPAQETAGAEVRQTLLAILEHAHAALGQPAELRCRGVFLDTLSADAQGALAGAAGLPGRDGAPLGDLGDLLVCPKPHIAPWRVDLVSRARHCCADRALCHIAGRPGVRKPERLPRDIRTLLGDLEQGLAEAGPRLQSGRGKAAEIAGRLRELLRDLADSAGEDPGSSSATQDD